MTAKAKGHEQRTANLMLVSGSRVLLLRRSHKSRNGKRWGLPGGRRERGEHPFHTALREALEEMDSLPPFELQDALSVRRRGKRCDIYVVRVDDTQPNRWTPVLSHEHVEHRWAKPRWCLRRLEKLHPVLRRVFEREGDLARVARVMRGESGYEPASQPV